MSQKTPAALGNSSKNLKAAAFSYLKLTHFEEGDVLRGCNPVSGCLAGRKWDDAPLNKKNIEKEKGKEQNIRQGILNSILSSNVVRLMVIFEHYVYALLLEAYDLTEWQNSENCEKRWSSAKGIVKKQLFNIQSCSDKDDVYSHVLSGDAWSYFLEKHRDKVLERFWASALSLHNIKIAMCDLFTYKEPDNSKKDIVKDMKDAGINFNLLTHSFEFAWSIPNTDETDEERMISYWICISEEETVSHILNLCYAIRCASVHGRINPTFKNALKNFPQKSADLKLKFVKKFVEDPSRNTKVRKNKRIDDLPEDHTVVTDNIFKVYTDLKKAAETQENEKLPAPLVIDYILCLNIKAFLYLLSKRLMHIIGNYAYYKLGYNEEGFTRFWDLKIENGEAKVPDEDPGENGFKAASERRT